MQEQPPPLREKLRMPLRIVVVVGGYFLAVLLDNGRDAARILLWAGIVMLGWLLVDRATMWARERSGMLVAGTTVLGLGAVGLGVYLAVR